MKHKIDSQRLQWNFSKNAHFWKRNFNGKANSRKSSCYGKKRKLSEDVTPYQMNNNIIVNNKTIVRLPVSSSRKWFRTLFKFTETLSGFRDDEKWYDSGTKNCYRNNHCDKKPKYIFTALKFFYLEILFWNFSLKVLINVVTEMFFQTFGKIWMISWPDSDFTSIS